MHTLTRKQAVLYTAEVNRYENFGMYKVCGIETYLKSRLETFLKQQNPKYYDMYEVVQYAENDY